jgi:UDP-2-acetamido-2,6-beta-L-arabino-hexul-4-ose reductase
MDKMINIGITGQAGFIGTYLYNFLGLQQGITRIPFRDEYFENSDHLEKFVAQCDVIVHLAALNRHSEPDLLYRTNIELVQKLITTMEKLNVRPHVLMSSSTQEERDNVYGRSKKEGRELFVNWSERNHAGFTGLIIPNVYGPFGRPFYNSVVSTFSYQLTHNETPKIETDAELNLIYIDQLLKEIYRVIDQKIYQPVYPVPYQDSARVTDILAILTRFKTDYLENKILPDLSSRFETSLFNTFRNYIEPDFYPVKYTEHQDERGSFVEVVKTGSGGQFSFSTTKPGITRGNHFHTRKVERFSVIKGEAVIRLRRIGTAEIIEYRLSGNEPSFVDIPVWHTHNITNVGESELLTLFWINEFFDPNDPDTFYEIVE